MRSRLRPWRGLVRLLSLVRLSILVRLLILVRLSILVRLPFVGVCDGCGSDERRAV